MRVAVALALVLSGCAARAAAPTAEEAPAAAVHGGGAPSGAGGEAVGDATAPERQIAFDEHAALLTLDTEIEALASAQDCGSACAGGERLCALSERVCAIAERLPNDAEIGARCADGRARCERARARLAEACGCE